jgi:hypothetical protein
MNPNASLLILIAGFSTASIIAARWKQRTRADRFLELCLVGLWALWVGREYLDFDARVWPGFSVSVGTINEFSSSIQPHFVWSRLTQCGACMLWNGAVNGGAPALADLYGATLHPVVIVTTLLFGAINGAKVTLVVSLFLAGAAQWWLARVMGLGRMACLWGAALAVVGGHLAGRMESGIVTLALSTASCSLVVAPGIELALTGKRRAAILFGIMLALAAMSGQGYLQVGLVLSILPAFVIFLFDRPSRVKSIWKEFALAGLIAVLLSAILWIPTLHFLPNISKGADSTFSSAQPITAALANLVTDDPSFYTTDQLGRVPIPHLYINYIGWIPILFALMAIVLGFRSNRRLVLFFAIAIGLVFLVATATTLHMLSWVLPDLMAAVRYPPLIAGLAVPLILGLAAWGLDQFLRLEWWTRLKQRPLVRSVAEITLAVILLWPIHSAYVFDQYWLVTRYVPPAASQVLETIDRSSAQWIGVPDGEHAWTALSLIADLKIANAFRPWNWQGHDLPSAFVTVTYDPSATSVDNRFGTTEGINLIEVPDNTYALIDTGTRHIPCQAIAHGGDIDVDCNSDAAGTLVVHENNWEGWRVTRDGEPTGLDANSWLSTAAPAGRHHYEFRYRPSDATIGLIASAIGIVLAVMLLIRASRRSL